MKYNRFRKLLPFAVMLAWMGVIFALSAQDGTQSEDTSGFFMELLMRLLPASLETWAGPDWMDRFHSIVRTLAHFTEYAVLGALALWAASGVQEKYSWATALGIGSLYAALDEWHQAYVPGRACQVSDWVVDTLGAAFGIVCILLLVALIEGIRRKKLETAGYQKTE